MKILKINNSALFKENISANLSSIIKESSGNN